MTIGAASSATVGFDVVRNISCECKSSLATRIHVLCVPNRCERTMMIMCDLYLRRMHGWMFYSLSLSLYLSLSLPPLPLLPIDLHQHSLVGSPTPCLHNSSLHHHGHPCLLAGAGRGLVRPEWPSTPKQMGKVSILLLYYYDRMNELNYLTIIW